MAIPAEFAAEFQREKAERTARAIWVVILITAPLWPLSTWIDWFAFREHFWPLFASRVVSGAVLGVLLLVLWDLRRRGRDAQWSRALVWAFVVIVGAYFDASSLILGGAESDYARAFLLLFFVLFAALPWSPVEMVAPVAFSGVQFLVVNLAFDPEVNWRSYVVVVYLFSAVTFIGMFWVAVNHRLLEDEFTGRKNLERERQRSETLLLNILPREVADELKTRGRVEARLIPSCSILFTDFVGFTTLAGRVPPADLVRALDATFTRFDEIVSRWGLDRMKTIGDAYMAAGGILAPQPDHLLRCVLAGLEMYHAIEDGGLTCADGACWRMRIGVHSGPVVAGIVGQKKFAFDLWGDTVNVASRLSDLGEPGTVAVVTGALRDLAGHFEVVDRGTVPVRGKGEIRITQVLRLKPEHAADPSGRLPGASFLESMGVGASSVAPTPRGEPFYNS